MSISNKMQVKTSDGIVEGELVCNEVSGKYYSFKGIPYAAPPIGDLRFKAPQPPEPWEGVRSAKSHGNTCHQYNFLMKTTEQGSEDCLYLNVYTPDVKPAKPLPVMIWIHGGAFCSGSGNDDLYGPDYLIRHGVILVTFNYRLEVIGFLCLHTEDIPGNAGIKDQVAVMRWVNKNIAQFGGDPDNVTIFGQSSGGASVTYHCISPMTKGLFKRGISQSGCCNNWLAQYYRPRDRAIALAKKLGCTSDDDKEIYEFFKTQPIDSLIKCQTPITLYERGLERYESQFAIVSEKVFPNIETYFTGSVTDAIKNNIHEGIELIIGYNADEATVHLAAIYDIDEAISNFNEMNQLFVPRDINLYVPVHDQLDIGLAVKQFYLKEKSASMETLDLMCKYLSCETYRFGIVQLAKFFSTKIKVYLYKFTCISERNFFSVILGGTRLLKSRELAGHTDELAYLFPIKSIKQNIGLTSLTFQMINNVSKLWTNFAKTGNPTPDISLGANWSPYNVRTQPYLLIGEKCVRALKPDKEEIEFFEQIYNKYFPTAIYRKS